MIDKEYLERRFPVYLYFCLLTRKSTKNYCGCRYTNYENQNKLSSWSFNRIFIIRSYKAYKVVFFPLVSLVTYLSKQFLFSLFFGLLTDRMTYVYQKCNQNSTMDGRIILFWNLTTLFENWLCILSINYVCIKAN